MLTIIELWILKIYLERLMTDFRNPNIGFSEVVIYGLNQYIRIQKTESGPRVSIDAYDLGTFGATIHTKLKSVEQSECSTALELDFESGDWITIGYVSRITAERRRYSDPDKCESMELTREQMNAGIPDGSIPAPIDLIEW